MPQDPHQSLREHLVALLKGGQAHATPAAKMLSLQRNPLKEASNADQDTVRFSLVLLFFLPILPAPAQSAASPYDAVDPFIGTAGGGNTFPGATLPFGMIQWSPDTNTDALVRL